MRCTILACMLLLVYSKPISEITFPSSEVSSLPTDRAMRVTQFVLNYMKENCPMKNSVICQVTPVTISDAQVQAVSGTIFKFTISTSLGAALLELWYQDMINILSIHRFSLLGNELIEAPIFVKKNIEEIKPILLQAVSS